MTFVKNFYDFWQSHRILQLMVPDSFLFGGSHKPSRGVSSILNAFKKRIVISHFDYQLSLGKAK